MVGVIIMGVIVVCRCACRHVQNPALQSLLDLAVPSPLFHPRRKPWGLNPWGLLRRLTSRGVGIRRVGRKLLLRPFNPGREFLVADDPNRDRHEGVVLAA